MSGQVVSSMHLVFATINLTKNERKTTTSETRMTASVLK